jgi:hypothetical protein
LPMPRATRLPRHHHRPGSATLLRHPIACLLPTRFPRAPRDGPKTTPGLAGLAQRGSAWALLRGYGNINPLSIDYACRPRLRPRLTQGGLAWPWNPWSSGGRVSHPACATHACIRTPTTSTAGSRRGFPGGRTLPYPPTHPHPTTGGGARLSCGCHSFGGVLEPRYIVGAEPLDQ